MIFFGKNKTILLLPIIQIFAARNKEQGGNIISVGKHFRIPEKSQVPGKE